MHGTSQPQSRVCIDILICKVFLSVITTPSLLGILRNYNGDGDGDGDGNRNVKKAIGSTSNDGRTV